MEGADIRKRIREYIEIVEFLKRMGTRGNLEGLDVTDRHIYITRERLEDLMGQPPYGKYDTSRNKLQVWKRLGWIEAPENRLAVQLRKDGKRVQRIKINRRVAEEFQALGCRNYTEA